MLESTGERIVDPRLDVFRDFVNSLDVDPDSRGPPELTSEPAVEPSATSMIGSAAAQGPRRFTHMRDPQPPEVADRPQDDLRLGAGRRAGRPRVVRHADLDHRPAAAAQLDQQLGREERPVGLDPDARPAPRAGTACTRSRHR